MAEKKTFPTNVSGLVRGIGPVTAVIITIAFTVGSGWQRSLFIYAGATPLPENLWFAGIPPMVMAFMIGGIIVLITMLGYSILISAMPRSGGGYVAISRILGPFPGFIGAWFQFLAVAIYFGWFAVLIFERVFLGIGPALGFLPPATSYNDVGFLIGALVLIVLTTVIVVCGVRITSYVLQLLVWIPVVLSLYVLFLLAIAIVSPSILQNGISVWALGHGFSGVTADTYVRAALDQGLDSASIGNYWTAVSAYLLGAYGTYIGYAALTFVAGEVKNPEKNFPRLLLIAPLIIIIMFVTMTAVGTFSAASVGQTTLPNGDRWSFFEAYSYLRFGGGSLQQAKLPNFSMDIPILASMVGTGLGLSSLNILLLIFGVGWIVNDLPVMALVGSRLVFAMSFDRVLPTSLSKVNARFRSPHYATILVGIVAVLGALSWTCILCNGSSWGPGGPVGDILTSIFGNGFQTTTLIEAIFFSLFALSVVLFPFRLRKSYEAAPFKPGGKLGVLTIGLAGLIANLTLVWLDLTSPADVFNILAPTSDNWFALGFVGLLGLIGCLIYAYFRFGPSGKEVDYTGIFSETPPE